MVSKRDIRRHALSLRQMLSVEERIEKSQCIYKKVISHPLFLEADTIFCYVNYKEEVCTRKIIETAWNMGKVVAVPKTNEMEMFFCEIHDFSDLKEGYKGILEPTTSIIPETEQGLVIMPGVAFDSKRNRVGYGKGYYDRFLKYHKNFNTMALAFSIQVFSEILCDIHDIKPEILITEEQIYV